MRFTARQTIDLRRPGFVWTARTGPLGTVTVVDRLEGVTGGGSVRLLGLIPLGGSDANPAILKGELLRYLAELPWAPDALLTNLALTWRVDSPRRLIVSAAVAGVRAEATFTLDEDGLIASVHALRPRQEGRLTRERLWSGTFLDYRLMDGRRVPARGEVSWEIDGQPFVCWRGTVEAYAVEG
jgi:hypothetical protein